MREIEIKVKVDNLKLLEEKLKKQGCLFSDSIHQYDVIYTLRGSVEEFEEAKEGDIIPRIRRFGKVAQFNLKQQRSSESDNIEYETEVKDPEAIHNILLLLGYEPQIEVKKIRRKGKMKDYKICLDKVEKLGKYIEIEKIVDDETNPKEVRQELFQILESLGLPREDEETRGYDTQIYYLNK